MKKVMKHSKKVFLMVAMIATVMGYANETSFYVSNKDGKKTRLVLDNVNEGDLFTIKDKNNVVLYKELIQKEGIYTKGFDLTSLPDGNYVFELDKNVEITSMPFSVNAKTVTFKKELAKTIFKPVTIVKGETAILTKLTLNKTPLEIKIYFSSDNSGEYELVHSEIIENTKVIEKAYKLADLDSGSYKMVYHTEGREFTKIID